MIATQPYSDLPAMTVLSRLDPYDLMEAEAIRGEAVTHLSLFADWRAMQALCLASWVVYTDPSCDPPFALVAVCRTGLRGVAVAAMLARDHRRFRRELVQLARLIRTEMPIWCAEAGVARVEARAWARHPRAAAFLTRVGFTHETDMPGFGRDGTETFRQFAWWATASPRPPQDRS